MFKTGIIQFDNLLDNLMFLISGLVLWAILFTFAIVLLVLEKTGSWLWWLADGFFVLTMIFCLYFLLKPLKDLQEKT